MRPGLFLRYSGEDGWIPRAFVNYFAATPQGNTAKDTCGFSVGVLCAFIVSVVLRAWARDRDLWDYGYGLRFEVAARTATTTRVAWRENEESMHSVERRSNRINECSHSSSSNRTGPRTRRRHPPKPLPRLAALRVLCFQALWFRICAKLRSRPPNGRPENLRFQP